MCMQPTLKALGDENRLKIIQLLLQHSYCVRALSKQLNISEPAVSQHLNVLKEVNLLIGEKRNRHVHYVVNRATLHELAQYIEGLSQLEQVVPDSTDVDTPRGQCFGHNKHGKCACHEDKGMA